MKNFRTYQLAVTLYRNLVVHQWPSHLRDQLKRAASSVVLNLAEGSGKPTSADRRRFGRRSQDRRSVPVIGLGVRSR